MNWPSKQYGTQTHTRSQALMWHRHYTHMFYRWCEVKTPCRIPGEFERVLMEVLNESRV